jgi:hypothetical protein
MRVTIRTSPAKEIEERAKLLQPSVIVPARMSSQPPARKAAVWTRGRAAR